jgi:hypothetical protein
MTVDPGSITQWLHQLQSGDPNAAKELWSRYYPKLVQTAAKYLQDIPDPAVGSEDVAQSAFQHFFRSSIAGEYSEVGNREELWKLLLVFSVQRIQRHQAFGGSLHRTFVHPKDGVGQSLLSVADLRTPEAEAQMSDLLEHLLQLLDEEDPSGELRRIGVLYLEDQPPREIARLLQRRTTTILQKLRLITILWEQCEEL